MEISKPIRFWKAYNVRSPKNNVYICAAPLILVAMARKILEFQLKISYNSVYARYVAENNARCTKQGVFEVGQFNDVTEIYFLLGSKSPFYPKLASV